MSTSRHDFFKLSCLENPKYSSIAACLKLNVNGKFGRHIVTTQKLKTGDIIAIEKPFYMSIDRNSSLNRCASCFSSSINLTSCGSCHSVMFCSKDCKELGWNKFHKYECSSINELTDDDNFFIMVQRTLFHCLNICGGLENFMQLVNSQKSRVTIFDFYHELSSENPMKFLICVCDSLEAAHPTDIDKKFAKSFVANQPEVKKLWSTNEQKNFLIKFIVRFIGIMNRNSFTLHWNNSDEQSDTACGIFPFASLINHSCAPNLDRICVGDSVAFIVKRPVNRGEQLFICYQ